jgi:ligand-binding sensor domain-containing protein
LKFFFLLLAFLPALGLPLQAQEYSYVNYNTRDGLAGSVVYCMLQDHDGFIWFGTESGLSRFDGTRFTNFTMADGLPDNEILKLFIDSKKRLWIVPFRSSLCYYRNGKIYTAQNDSLIRKISVSSEVVCVQEDTHGDLIISERRKITLIKTDGSKQVIDRFGKEGTFLIDAGTGRAGRPAFMLRRANTEASLWELQNDHLTKIATTRDTVGAVTPNLVVLSSDLYAWPDDQHHFSIHPVVGKSFIIPCSDGSLRLRRLNDSILAICSSQLVETYHITQQKKQHTFFVNKSINDMMEDREGNLWFSSLGQGIFRLASTEFKNLFLRNGENNMPVISLKKIGPLLYAGADRFTLWSFNTGSGQLASLKMKTGFTQGKITTIDTLQSELLVGTDNDAFLIRNGAIKPMGWRDALKSIVIDSNNIYIASSLGAYMTDIANKIYLVFLSERATTLYKQGDSLYIGSLKGLYKTNAYKNTKEPDRYLGTEHEVFRTRINAITEDRNGVLWMASYGRGVVGYKNNRIIALIDQSKGLSSNICRSIFASDNAVWVGTDKGLNKLQFTGGRVLVTKYTRADGLMSEIINAIAVDKDTVYVGTPEGLTWFAESKVFTNSMCVLKITSVSSDKKHWVSDFTGLHFDHYDNNIRVEYAGISFKSVGEISYRYRLSGIDDTWRTTTASYLTFPTLPSGEYELQLQAVNKFGVRSDMVSLQFDIAQLLWEKTWFRLLCMVLLGVSIWIFVQQRIQHIKKREALRSATNNRIAELEQMALKAQMNPHFIFNTLNSIQQYIFDKDVQDANKFIIEFSRLIRLTLDISSKTKITIGEEVNYISTYLQLEKRRFEDKFDFRIHLSSNDLLTAYIPPMILQPYIENSIRHGVRYRNDSAGLITVAIYTTDHYLVCTVEDNGIGREASKQFKGTQNIEYQSKGMTLTARRIEMMNRSTEVPIDVQVEDLYDEKQQPWGTRVMIRFPLHKV